MQSLGLLGIPDGQTSNDWMTPEGEQVEVTTIGKGIVRHHGAYEYCYNNWCVSQKDSLMAHSGDMTYEYI